MKRAARRIVEKLRLHGHEAFFAGGWVRDLVMRRKPKDIDIATSALPTEVLELFPNSRAIGAQFGVVQVLMYGHAYEVATFRSDNSYIDGRHPSSVSFCGPEQDALRRDFTVNGLFYDPIADRLIDYVRGKYDIQNRLLRTIGDPRAVPYLIKVLRYPGLWDRYNAADALGRLKDRRALGPLIHALEREDPTSYTAGEKKGMMEDKDPARSQYIRALQEITGLDHLKETAAWLAWWKEDGEKDQ